MIRITTTISIDENDIHEEFVRASGPGGQHVNKVATAVQLRFDVRSSGLPQELKARLRRIAGRRMTEAGILTIHACRFRTQERNRQDALQRLIALLRDAAKRPQTRKKTTPGQASKQRRLDKKRQRSRLKQLRRFDSWAED
ncbi:aminoacyl-tRNA hydrolase [candidate division KSB3 bacterium]|uniref:Aminoacyl-tRNA hydrolase n=1 Tax=candidate division KSB3 bacterium TaxID=2044937 RepID=A0A2G6EAY9_9BACT|nr:MAG: aminoacyl-tRNA hydrolase [candidate division KSB3 bacterium]PIE31002.1 MAG: aminoacyl-tRNA hydrolase [candidate division KSB3 bacterium]